ncbi:hypothetical protein SAMN05216569_2265 [Pseudoxanthomonas sp. CF125]|nr:hypothetical protein SAMN05216569_2265 [Pseudoxanthomonas sp. CF125]
MSSVAVLRIATSGTQPQKMNTSSPQKGAAPKTPPTKRVGHRSWELSCLHTEHTAGL